MMAGLKNSIRSFRLMAKIFINYRRKDSAPYAILLYDRLVCHFGRDHVFMDIDQIEPGEVFDQVIQDKLKAVQAAVVLIGAHWLDIADANGRRLDNPDDWVRLEIAALLERNIRVIPVLVGGAAMPKPVQLPDCLAPLVSRQAHEISDQRFHSDVDKLVQVLEKVLSSEPVLVSTSFTSFSTEQSTETRLPFEPETVLISPGKFLMGSLENELGRLNNEGPQHEVTIGYTFAIGRYAVTFDEYDTFAKVTNRVLPDDESWGRGRKPVINVSFLDAKAYVGWLSAQTGKSYRLPTEAEWEYAARAGTRSRYWLGDDIGKNNASCDCCRSQWDRRQTAPVGSFKANSFGLHDTAGNVWEWVEDCWHESYHDAPNDGSAWLEKDGIDCKRRVIRGGSWSSIPQNLRSANRFKVVVGGEISDLGFRIARDL